MSGNKLLLDTNIVLEYLGNKQGIGIIENYELYVSFITGLELLSYPVIQEEEIKKIEDFLKLVNIIDISGEIKSRSVILRKKYRLRLPDAIICATAFVQNCIFVTNDKHLLKITEIQVKNLSQL